MRPAAVLGALPLVIGHRGAPGYLPDHTIAGYTLAVRQGADFIEPDLVPTRDGVLVARHENDLSETTDVAHKFPERRATKTIDGRVVTGFFTEDFTLAELKTLRARQPFADRDHGADDQHEIPTFDEVLGLAVRLSAEVGRPIGVYPETKHPTYFAGIGLPLEDALLASLAAVGLDDADDPVFIQSFEPDNLRALRARTPVRLIQLVGGPTDHVAGDPARPTYAQILADLGAVATWAHGLGVHKSAVIPVIDGVAGAPTDLVPRAHAVGLLVHVYTFRAEPRFLPAGVDVTTELGWFFAQGVDGVFADQPDLAVAARAR